MIEPDVEFQQLLGLEDDIDDQLMKMADGVWTKRFQIKNNKLKLINSLYHQRLDILALYIRDDLEWWNEKEHIYTTLALRLQSFGVQIDKVDRILNIYQPSIKHIVRQAQLASARHERYQTTKRRDITERALVFNDMLNELFITRYFPGDQLPPETRYSFSLLEFFVA